MFLDLPSTATVHKHWKEIALELFDNKTVMIASYDLNLNDQPNGHHHFKHYPTIRLFSKDSKRDFNELPRAESKTISGVKNWINKNCLGIMSEEL